ARGGWLDFLDLHPQRPITALSEAFACVSHLLSQNKAPYAGEIFSLAGGESLRWQIDYPNPPYLLGSWGSKTIQACIDQISEVKLGGTANPAVIPSMQDRIVTAATEAGRDPGSVALVAGAVTVVDEDGAAAKALARREAALYLPIIATLDPTLALEPELLDRINQAAARYDFDQAGAYISDDLLQQLAFAGTPDEVAEQALKLFEAGVGRVEFGTPHGLTTAEGLRLLGERVLPALRQT
ncbi:MAG: LLM class flavin-dependent oxidoreductase, partial [Chloroflexota bacterium]